MSIERLPRTKATPEKVGDLEYTMDLSSDSSLSPDSDIENIRAAIDTRNIPTDSIITITFRGGETGTYTIIGEDRILYKYEGLTRGVAVDTGEDKVGGGLLPRASLL